MNLVWKLLRQHISIGQLAGFFLANLFGTIIVLLSLQFYKDVVPMFAQGDSFMKKEYLIATKKISTLGSFAGKSNAFTKADMDDHDKEEVEKLKKRIEDRNAKHAEKVKEQDERLSEKQAKEAARVLEKDKKDFEKEEDHL